VVAVGGDGTVHEAVNGLLRGGAPAGTELAVVAQGTGDDFIRALGIPANAVAALSVAREGRARTIDAGRVRYLSPEGGAAEAFFASVAGVGMSGAVARRLNTTTKALGGRASGLIALVAVFARWSNVGMAVEVDGVGREGSMQDVLVANTPYHNGGMKLCPGAEPDDGLFDVLVIGDVSKTELVRIVPKLYRGTHLPHPKGELLRGRNVVVESERPLPIELDGEQPGTTPARFELLPGAVRVRVPR
jgi:diacylglycerol kinase (ATP)